MDVIQQVVGTVTAGISIKFIPFQFKNKINIAKVETAESRLCDFMLADHFS